MSDSSWPSRGPAWVDHSSRHVPGLFPLAVERVFNQVVAEHALAVTTVTTGARYYALHGLVAHEASRTNLNQEQARNLLRRCEVAIALVTLQHQTASDHDHDRAANGHAVERLRVLWRNGPIDLTTVTGDGPQAYIRAKWGVLGSTYRGAEMTLKVLEPSGLSVGPKYDDAAVRPALEAILDLARREAISEQVAADFGHLCLCQAADGPDGAWLRDLFTAPNFAPGTRGHRQAQTTKILARAIKYGRIRDVHTDLVPFLMTHPKAITPGEGEDIARRWRGIAFRYEAVNAWRYLWQALSDQVGSVGVATRQEMRDWLADHAPPGTVRQFSTGLPPVVDSHGNPLTAERHPDLVALSDVLRHVAVAMLTASRLPTLHEQERFGFEGGPKTPTWALEEELSPRWVGRRTTAWADRSMSDFLASLSDVLIDRAQRLSLQKARFDVDRGVVVPGRITTRDNLVYRVFGEQARPAALRLPQLMHMCRQVGLFDGPAYAATVMGPLGETWQLTDRGLDLA